MNTIYRDLAVASVLAVLLAPVSMARAESILVTGCASGPSYDFSSISEPTVKLRIPHDRSSQRDVTIHVVQGITKPTLYDLTSSGVTIDMPEFGGRELIRQIELGHQIDVQVGTGYDGGKDKLVSFDWSTTSIDCPPRPHL